MRISGDNIYGFISGFTLAFVIIAWAATEYIMSFDQFKSWFFHKDLMDVKVARALTKPADKLLALKEQNNNLKSDVLNCQLNSNVNLDSLKNKCDKLIVNLEKTKATLFKAETEISEMKRQSLVVNRNGNNNSGGSITNNTDLSITTNEIEKIKFTIQACRLSAKIIDCSLLITNKRSYDIKLAITNGTLFDQNGTRFNANNTKIGGHSTGFQNKQDLISSIPTKSQISFDVNKGNVKKITALKFNTYGAYDGDVSRWGAEGSGVRRISLKNVPLSR